MQRVDPREKYAGVKVLVLEDEAYIRQIIRRLLRQIGFKLITEVEDGTEGFREMLRVNPDVILCDIHMTPIDGMTFLRKLRQINHETIAKVPLIFLTADAELNTVMSAKELRVDGYLTKPVSVKALKERLDAVLGFEG